ncbi:unnamed protein product [Protopolystoma xenopodis]|uniref:Uncharacterized protein n=1 Tax=Protopolystoma xenopodis TaxID=117903 RepID=A0A448WLB4_9PLAT|nr:unnamed protein product [Protopolystoma xenopodis]
MVALSPLPVRTPFDPNFIAPANGAPEGGRTGGHLIQPVPRLLSNLRPVCYQLSGALVTSL